MVVSGKTLGPILKKNIFPQISMAVGPMVKILKIVPPPPPFKVAIKFLKSFHL